MLIRSMRLLFTALLVLSALLLPRPPVALAAGTVIYVNATAGGSNNGTNWTNAYTSLQSALTAATGPSEIWVATGTYTPGSSRTGTFRLKNNVAIYGGFAGTETLLSARNWATNVVTLSGEIGAAGNSDNSYHVVTGGGTNASAILDGVSITGGYAYGTDPHDRGGGMYNAGSSPTLTNVTFSGNAASLGGGMVNGNNSSPILTNVTFSGNSALLGGGMVNIYSSNPTLTNVTIRRNSAFIGGGMVNQNSSNPILTNVTISGNSTTHSGGGMYNDSSNPILTNVTISRNAADMGGGMYNSNSNPTLTNVTISGNAANMGGGMYNSKSSSPTLTNVTFSGNAASSGGGMVNSGSNPTLTNVMISGNAANYGGGMANLFSSNPTLTNVTISGNKASTGGGMANVSSSNPQIRNSIVWGNSGTQIANSSSTPVVSFSITQGGYAGTNNLDADPLFVTPISATSAPTTTGNYRLTSTSPAINAGDNSVTSPSLPATDMDGNPRIIGGTVDMGAYEAFPHVTSIVRAAASPTSAATVPFTVTFNMPVTGITTNAFALTSTGLTNPAVTGVTGSGTTWTVMVNTGSGDGTLRLDLQDTDAITSTPNVALGGAGNDNGDYTSGESYTIDKTAPNTTITAQPANPTTSTSASFSFSSTGGTSFACKLDNGVFSACTSPKTYTDLVAGDHTFQVRAVDAAGNIDTTPASYIWTIEYRVFLPVVTVPPTL